jgi:hypothetical protein
MSRLPSGRIASQVHGLAADGCLIADLDPEGIEEHDRIHRLKRPGLPRRHLGVNGTGDRADEVRRDLHHVHLAEKRLDLAHREAAGVQRQNLVVEAGESPLVLADQLRRERPVAITRDVERQRAVVGQDRLTARAVAVIDGPRRLLAARRIPEMVRQLAAEHPLDQGLLEPLRNDLDLALRHRAGGAGELVEDRLKDGRGFGFAGPGHRNSSRYAPHTKFLTPSWRARSDI